ncbi:MAG: 30S ribosomal protein S6 [Parcubacteria group bacterium GW2011_GWA2_43_9b]|uniref:Small ribosomal subunit protein bS6 n=1 Tax=Candidatus Portnoybacteria bacterium RIFCSPLOWO2_02_FULL_39_11 TaxID=1802001 RepID=A0A1G2FSG2_9BACT|nr:MAG: 30S ribosomal protein S6 [Parcubacteria group bacterium GW2011_GWA2_43_9b]OGZ40481.1 MAG: 30S ribosomal protein S6 [Candidatus Portnoybacteria bacterium RIFCSPLOWO2_02_FULL_39_11]
MYELTYIINPVSGEIDANAVAAKVRSFIMEQLIGQIKKEYIGEKKRLSYSIKKRNSGIYATVEFTAEPEKIDELTKFLELNNDVLRHLILTADEKAKVKRPARIKPMATGIPAEEISTARTEKVGIEELDRKLEELLK